MTDKYAVFIEARSEHKDCLNSMRLSCERAKDRESADFKVPPWNPVGWHNLNVTRYNTLESAIKSVDESLKSSHINGCWIDVAGVVLIDQGNHTYKQYGQTVQISEPVYSARAITHLEKLTDYDINEWGAKLANSNEDNETDPPPEEWDKLEK